MDATLGIYAFFFVVMFSIAVLTLGSIAFWIWAFVDALNREDWMFRSGNRLTWALVVGLGGVVGAIVYVTVGRTRLAGGR